MNKRLANTSEQHFAKRPGVNKPRSTFLRPYRAKHTFDEGFVVPFYHDEVLPSDTHEVSTSYFSRFQTLINPVMDNLYMEFIYVFYPLRLLWDKSEEFFGQKNNPADDPTSLVIPKLDLTTLPSSTGGTTVPMYNTLWDNMGLPIFANGGGLGSDNLPVTGMPSISALRFRAYNRFYNEWIKDQALQEDLPVNNDSDGPDDWADYSEYVGSSIEPFYRINKYKDYFVTARPSPQMGNAISTMLTGAPSGSLTGSAEVWGTSSTNPGSLTNNQSPLMVSYSDRATDGYRITAPAINQSAASPPTITDSTDKSITLTGSGAGVVGVAEQSFANKAFSQSIRAGATAPLAADMSTATFTIGIGTLVGPTISNIRLSAAIQQVFEMDMQGGSRYIESCFNFFGAINPDFRLQRGEILGYAREEMNVHVTAQTSESNTTPQANLAAYATIGGANGFRKHFTEHGIVLGLVTSRTAITYQEGIDRDHTRVSRFDFYNPIFANITEQAIYNYELSLPAIITRPLGDAFGYKEPWAEYRFKNNKITGRFRSSPAGNPSLFPSLDSWHWAQNFGLQPGLETTFIQENAPIDRTIAVTNEPHFIFDVSVHNRTTRVMPMYSVPGMGRI